MNILWILLLVISLFTVVATVIKIIVFTILKQKENKYHIEMGRKKWFDTFGEDIFNDKYYKG
jgi:hypothetical protein